MTCYYSPVMMVHSDLALSLGRQHKRLCTHNEGCILNIPVFLLRPYYGAIFLQIQVKILKYLFIIFLTPLYQSFLFISDPLCKVKFDLWTCFLLHILHSIRKLRSALHICQHSGTACYLHDLTSLCCFSQLQFSPPHNEDIEAPALTPPRFAMRMSAMMQV